MCRSILSPKCNCAVLKLKNSNVSALPEVVDSMDGLRHVEIMNVGLQRLSPEFGKTMRFLAYLNLRDNELSALPDFPASSLHTIDVSFNRLQALPANWWK